MKKFFGVFIFILLIAGVFFMMRPQAAQPHSGKLRVVASGYVPYTLAKQLVGDAAEVSMLLPANAEPHSFEPTPGALVSVKRADVFVYISNRLEPWAKDIAQGAGENTLVLEAAAQVPVSGDPHIWMSFENTQKIAAALASALAQQDPAHQERYAENLQKLEQELSALDQEFGQGLANCHSREVVHVGHLAFKHLTSKYNLSLSALAGSSHDGEHSVHKLAELVKFIKNKNIAAIFTEETLSFRLSATVSGETGARILPLYTVEHVSKQDFDNGVTYADLMRRTLKSLQEGLGCQA